MRRALLVMLLATAGCGPESSSNDASSTSGGGSTSTPGVGGASGGGASGGGTTSGSGGGTDPLCATQPVSLGVHPHAVQQPTAEGKSLIDTRGYHGRLYFAYGDLAANTGPIEISSYDPVQKTWQDHLTFQTERIQQFRVIQDQMWAGAADPTFVMPDHEYAVGTPDHMWGQVDIGTSRHANDIVERVPGEFYIVGSDWVDINTNMYSASVWRSDGGPFVEIFPKIDPDPFADQLEELNGVFINVAALNGKIYIPSGGSGWTYDGTKFEHGVVLGQFLRPTTFAGVIVFDTLGELFSFDGTTTKHLGLSLFPSLANYQWYFSPIALFQDVDDRLVAVRSDGSVVVTTDLVTWTCIGQAPPDVSSIGALNGTIYFGGVAGDVYGYEAPSW
jgi:hypothetical protein